MIKLEAIDIERLLDPISEELPGGSDPRANASFNSLYNKVKDARSTARSIERASAENGTGHPQEWEIVAETALLIIGEHAKDLEVAAWLTEALLRLQGFSGLRDGFQLITGIVTHYWENCFPTLDEDGVEGKISAIRGLFGSGATGTLIVPARLVPITSGSQLCFSLWDYEQASHLANVTDEALLEEHINNGKLTMSQFDQSVAETPSSFFTSCRLDLAAAIDAIQKMIEVLNTVAQEDAPVISSLIDLLETSLGLIKHVSSDDPDEMDFEEPNQANVSLDLDQQHDLAQQQGYNSRKAALEALKQISIFFRKTEPHSPISYTLEDAVRRAHLSLPELLAELTSDPEHAQQILLAAGIKTAKYDE